MSDRTERAARALAEPLGLSMDGDGDRLMELADIALRAAGLEQLEREFNYAAGLSDVDPLGAPDV